MNNKRRHVFLVLILSISLEGQAFSQVLGSKWVSKAVKKAKDNGAQTSGQAADACRPDKSGYLDLEIDASNPQPVTRTKYALKDRVRVVVVNENPFAFAYRLKVQTKTVEEAGFADFLSALGGIVAAQIAPPKTDNKPSVDAAAKSVAASRNAPLTSCTPFAEADLQRLATNQAALKDLDTKAFQAFRDMDALRRSTLAVYDRNKGKLANKEATCGTLYAVAGELIGPLTSLIKAVDDLKDTVQALQEGARQQVKDIELFFVRYPECRPTTPNLVQYRNDARVYLGEIDEYLERLKEPSGISDQLKKVVKSLQDYRNKPYEIQIVGPFNDPTDVEITLERKELGGSDFTVIADDKINFGGTARFSVAGGVVFSGLEKFEFKRVQGFARDRAGNLVDGKTLTSVIDQTEHSSTRILPMLVLHGRILDLSHRSSVIDAIHLSLGITAKNDNKGTEVEYLIGPSVSFAGERLFFTVGGYAGKQQQLQDSLFVGQEAPKDLGDDFVRKNYHWKLGFALTFKIK